MSSLATTFSTDLIQHMVHFAELEDQVSLITTCRTIYSGLRCKLRFNFVNIAFITSDQTLCVQLNEHRADNVDLARIQFIKLLCMDSRDFRENTFAQITAFRPVQCNCIVYYGNNLSILQQLPRDKPDCLIVGRFPDHFPVLSRLQPAISRVREFELHQGLADVANIESS